MIKSRKEMLKKFYADSGKHHIQDLIKYITLTVITIIASIIVAIVSDYIYGIITFIIPFIMIFANTLDTKNQIKNDFDNYIKNKPINELKQMCDTYKYPIEHLKKLLNTYFTTTSLFIKNDTYDEIISRINILDIINNKESLKTIINDFEKDINKIHKTIDDLDEYIKNKNMAYEQIAMICDNAKTTLENILPNYDIKIITEDFLKTYQTKSIPEKLLETDTKTVSDFINNKKRRLNHEQRKNQ